MTASRSPSSPPSASTTESVTTGDPPLVPESGGKARAHTDFTYRSPKVRLRPGDQDPDGLSKCGVDD